MFGNIIFIGFFIGIARLFYCGGKHVSLMVKNGETGKHSMCTIHIVRYTKVYN